MHLASESPSDAQKKNEKVQMRRPPRQSHQVMEVKSLMPCSFDSRHTSNKHVLGSLFNVSFFFFGATYSLAKLTYWLFFFFFLVLILNARRCQKTVPNPCRKIYWCQGSMLKWYNLNVGKGLSLAWVISGRVLAAGSRYNDYFRCIYLFIELKSSAADYLSG